MTLFKNIVKLKGLPRRQCEVPPSDGITDDACAVLTLCVESGTWWRPANERIWCIAWYRIVCPGPYFCGFTRGMTEGSYIEVEGCLDVHHYAALNHKDPAYEIRATQIRRLELPSARVIEQYDG